MSENNSKRTNRSREKILLAMLPFNDPQIPPLGIANIKSFLKRENYAVKAVDANTEIDFRELFDRYFEIVKESVPENRRGNFYSMRLDIMQNQLMAYLNYRKRLDGLYRASMAEPSDKDKMSYLELVKILVHRTFYVDIDDTVVYRLDNIIREFYQKLEVYILDLLEKEKPAILGLSVCIAMLPASLFAFKLTKERYPHIKTIMGGGIFADDLALDSPNFDYFIEKTPYIDKIIVGEGELLFLKYLRGELPESSKVYSLKSLDGRMVDISAVDIPDFEDFDCDYYPYLPNNASLGCPFNCNFCSIPIQWGRYRKKTAAQIVKELSRLYEIFGRQLFFMVDSLLNPVMTDLATELIKSDLSLYWDGSLKISKEVCKTDNTLLWRRGGFYRARIGVETGSQRLLDLMDKKITVEEIKTATASLAYAGIKTTTFWIIGFPGETEEDFQQTLELVEELKDDIYEATNRPYLYYEMNRRPIDKLQKSNKSIRLYPPEAKDKLIIQTYIRDCPPSRQETYKRLNKFNEHIRKLGIPNPYSMYELNQADERWKKLHANGVPAIAEFSDRRTYIDECKHVEQVLYLQNTLEVDESFEI